MLRKFQEDARLEQMNEARRKRELVAYKLEIERLIEERREQYKNAVEAEYEEMRKQEEQEGFRQAVIERERQRLLREHATELKDYLPKNVFRNDADYETVHKVKPHSQPSQSQEVISRGEHINPITGRPVSRGGQNPAAGRPPSGGQRGAPRGGGFQDEWSGSRPGSGRRRPPSGGGGGMAGMVSPKSRDSLDNFAIDNHNRPASGGRPPSSSRRSRPNSGGGQYTYHADKGPADRPF